MKIRHINAVLVLATMACAVATISAKADVERIDYEPTSNVQSRRTAEDKRGFAVSGTSVVAFSVMPALAWPARDWDVTGFRFDLLVGDHTDVYGLDIGVLGNMVKREFCGLQLAGFFNVIGESDGALQIAPIFNNCKGAFAGVQISLANAVEKGKGVQIGLVNRANTLAGVQIGLLNIIDSSPVSVMPILNASF